MADPLGIVPGTINSYGNARRYHYDAAGRLWLQEIEVTTTGRGGAPLDTSSSHYVGGVIPLEMEYDANSNLLARRDGYGNETTYTYDALGRRTTQVNADGGSLSQVWDDEGRLVQLTDANGSIFDHSYDAEGRRTRTDITPNPSKTIAGGLPLLVGTQLQTFAYDGLGRLVRVTDDNDPSDADDDVTVTMARDSLGRVVEEVQDGDPVGHSYDSAYRSALHYPGSSRVVERTYNAVGAMTSVAQPPLTSVDFSPLTFGNPCSDCCRCACGDGAGSTDTTTTTTLDDGSTTVITEELTLNPVTGLPDSAVMDTEIYTGVFGFEVERDDNHQVTETTVSLGAPGLLPETEDSFYWSSVTLDSNSQGMTEDADFYVSGSASGYWIDEFTPSWAASSSWVSGAAPGNQGLSRSSTFEITEDGYRYNASPGTGIRSEDPDHIYQWDAMDRLRVVRLASDPDTVIARYTYDAHPAIMGGRRVKKVITETALFNGTTRYLYDADHVIEERDEDETLLRQFIYGQGTDEVLAIDTDSDDDGVLDNLLYMARDHNNNVIALIHSSGYPAEWYAYDLYGTPEIYDPYRPDRSTFAFPERESFYGNPYLFTGRRYEPETGLYYYRARYYDPADGEFISRDPIGMWGDPSGMGNGFAYAGGRPWDQRDPSGLDPHIMEALDPDKVGIGGTSGHLSEKTKLELQRRAAELLWIDEKAKLQAEISKGKDPAQAHVDLLEELKACLERCNETKAAFRRAQGPGKYGQAGSRDLRGRIRQIPLKGINRSPFKPPGAAWWE
jgi:RHS repeat-associated protein